MCGGEGLLVNLRDFGNFSDQRQTPTRMRGLISSLLKRVGILPSLLSLAMSKCR